MSGQLQEALTVMRKIREADREQGSTVTYLHDGEGEPIFAALVDLPYLARLQEIAEDDGTAHDHREGNEDD